MQFVGVCVGQKKEELKTKTERKKEPNQCEAVHLVLTVEQVKKDLFGKAKETFCKCKAFFYLELSLLARAKCH